MKALIFGLDVYERVIDAYFAGVRRLLERDGDPAQVHSVASFFVSRVDTEADRLLPADSPARGRVAVANAKLAYERFRQKFAGAEWAILSARGATVQRPLWASTGTKNEAYSDILYVQELIGPDTVNTMPPQTIDAFDDHGVVRRTIDEGYDEAVRALDALAEAGISLEEVTDELQRDGVKLFSDSFDQIGETVALKAGEIGKRVSAA